MATNIVKLSERLGFSFNDVLIDNNEIMHGLYLMNVDEPTLPPRQYNIIDVPYKDGFEYSISKYEDVSVDIKIGIFANTVQQRRAMQRDLITRLLSKPVGQLSFLDEPDIYREAYILDAIDVNDKDFFTELNISFVCKFCKYKNTDKVSYNTANIDTQTVVNYINDGNYYAYPLIKVTAKQACTKAIINNGTYIITLLGLTNNEVIYVDCEKQIVYSEADGVKTNKRNKMQGKFFSLSPGVNKITYSGESYKYDVGLTYKHTYIS